MGFRVERSVGGRTLSVETGKLAKQADGAVVVQYGETIALVTAVKGREIESPDIVPLTVEYREKTAAAGKIPGGFIKREGRPSDKEILTMRMIDRPLRPLFPPGYKYDTQISAFVLSADKSNDPDILCMIGASASLCLANLGFPEPVGVVRIGRLDGNFIINPTYNQLEKSELDLVVAGTESSIVMVEGAAREISEEVLIEALLFAQDPISEVVKLQRQLMEQCGIRFPAAVPTPQISQISQDILRNYYHDLKQRLLLPTKKMRQAAKKELYEKITVDLTGGREPDEKLLGEVAIGLDLVERAVIRDLALEGRRIDGRHLDEVRPIECEVGVLPRTHGSAVFTRGETQALVTATLGTALDEQKVEALHDEYYQKFMLHYNFPPFSVGEVRPYKGPSRREIGHGHLAERALVPVLPTEDEFPYTIRLVSDILESNGSSSMATVCGGSLCLMDAGVPISSPVAGIAMGLIKEKGEVRILTDIIGNEDHHGDMDLKVAGTIKGITAFQMDVKIPGVTADILNEILKNARRARFHVLDKMITTIPRPRKTISEHAPKLVQIRINPDKIGILIGPGGKTISRIQEETKTRIEVEDDGTVTISSPNMASVERAKAIVQGLTEQIKVGNIYLGKVVSTKESFAIIEISPGQEGLMHISELAEGYVRRIEDHIRVGDEVKVKVISMDDTGRIRLSRKAALAQERNIRDEEDSTVTISSPDMATSEKSRTIVPDLTEEITVGNIYTGKVVSMRESFAIVEILPGQEGLLHISELAEGYVRRIEDHIRVGDEVKVKVISKDDTGRIRLSRKAALAQERGSETGRPARHVPRSPRFRREIES